MLTIARKLRALLTPAQRRSALVLLGFMFIGMALETLGVGLIIPTITLLTQSDLTQYPAARTWIERVGNPGRSALIVWAMLTLTAVYLLITPVSGGSIGGTFPQLLTDLALLALGLAVYGAVFAFIGALVPRPLVAGLILIFGWEQVALLVPGYLRRFTVAHYLQGLVPHAMPQDDTVTAIQSLFSDPPTALSSITTLVVILIAALFLAARTVERREYVLDQ